MVAKKAPQSEGGMADIRGCMETQDFLTKEKRPTKGNSGIQVTGKQGGQSSWD